MKGLTKRESARLMQLLCKLYEQVQSPDYKAKHPWQTLPCTSINEVIGLLGDIEVEIPK